MFLLPHSFFLSLFLLLGRRNAIPSLVRLMQSSHLRPLQEAATFSGSVQARASGNTGGREGGKLALVFGREVEGLLEEEIAACAATCAIQTGRLQESLSVSHAVSIVLSRLYEEQLLRFDAQPSTPHLNGGTLHDQELREKNKE